VRALLVFLPGFDVSIKPGARHLSNIYLDKFDTFVEQELIPQYTRGALRAANPAYRQTDALLRRARRRGDRTEARHLMKQMRMLPSTDPMDPSYRRLRYVRYADDHLLGFTGSRAEAEQIKARLAEFLRETLGLELNDSKTLISHARTQPARFLGYDIIVQHSSTKITRNRRSVNGRIALRVPPDVVKAQCARYRQHGKPSRRTRLQNQDDYDIVRVYAAEYRGVVNYYLLAQDVWRLGTLRWHAETSMLKPWPPSTSPPSRRWPPVSGRRPPPVTGYGPASRPDATGGASRTW
jgi:hypothetical protein